MLWRLQEFGEGLVPSIPSGSSVTVLSMVATTCIPFNMFLASHNPMFLPIPSRPLALSALVVVKHVVRFGPRHWRTYS